MTDLIGQIQRWNFLWDRLLVMSPSIPAAVIRFSKIIWDVALHYLNTVDYWFYRIFSPSLPPINHSFIKPLCHLPCSSGVHATKLLRLKPLTGGLTVLGLPSSCVLSHSNPLHHNQNYLSLFNFGAANVSPDNFFIRNCANSSNTCVWETSIMDRNNWFL